MYHVSCARAWLDITPTKPMDKTLSERLFEEFCRGHGLSFDPVTRAACRTPDYDVWFGDRQVVVEVKQLEPNAEDRAQLLKLEAGGPATFGGEAGKRVRQEITDAKKQLRSRAKGRFPGLLVLYNTAPLISYLDPMFILLAMYGELTATIDRSSNAEKRTIQALSFGRKRSVSTSQNTTISAVCVLVENPEGHPTLTFYHNRFAALPFDPSWLRGELVRHYVLTTPSAKEFEFWTAA